MAIRKIITDGDPLLRLKAREVTKAELKAPDFSRLVADMVETMKAAGGVGLAAPQIGLSWRVFIAESPDGPVALVNPVFTDKSWKMTKDEEGCLSVPGQTVKVRRHKSLTVTALSAAGEPVSFRADNFFARVLQHEMDHLNGTLITDHQETARR